MKRAQAGFTLLELMVVLAIAGVLMAVAIPAMGDFIRNGRITGAASLRIASPTEFWAASRFLIIVQEEPSAGQQGD